jgi:hypothetical protein
LKNFRRTSALLNVFTGLSPAILAILTNPVVLAALGITASATAFSASEQKRKAQREDVISGRGEETVETTKEAVSVTKDFAKGTKDATAGLDTATGAVNTVMNTLSVQTPSFFSSLFVILSDFTSKLKDATERVSTFSRAVSTGSGGFTPANANFTTSGGGSVRVNPSGNIVGPNLPFPFGPNVFGIGVANIKGGGQKSTK